MKRARTLFKERGVRITNKFVCWEWFGALYRVEGIAKNLISERRIEEKESQFIPWMSGVIVAREERSREETDEREEDK